MQSTEIEDTRIKLTDCYHTFSQGLSFDSLDANLRKIKQEIKYSSRRHPAKIAEASKELHDILNNVSKRMMSKEIKAYVTDDELVYLLAHHGVLDEDARDKGLFFVFSGLMAQQVLSRDQIKQSLLYLTQDEVIFDHILDPEDIPAFGRSNAVLMISMLLVCDRSYGGILTAKQYWHIIEQVSLYAILERDMRGYTEPFGWLHAFTHIGDVLAESVESQLNRGEKLFFMTAVLVGYQEQVSPLIYGEDARLADAMVSLMQKEHFYRDFCLDLLHHWFDLLPGSFEGSGLAFWNQWYNRERFCNALLLNNNLPEEIRKYIRKMQA